MTEGHIYDISIYPETGGWGVFDLTAATGAPNAAGSPWGYLAGVPRVVYGGHDRHVYEISIYPETGGWGVFDLTAATGAPLLSADDGGGRLPRPTPMGYMATVPRVVYRGEDDHVYEIAIYPETGGWGVFDLTAATGAPNARWNPMGYLADVPRVVYPGDRGHINEIAISPQSGSWQSWPLTVVAGGNGAVPAGGAMGFLAGVPRVVYGGQDYDIYLFNTSPESGSVERLNLTARTNAPRGTLPMGYMAGVPRIVFIGVGPATGGV